jgi:protein disulfide-isomerase
VFDQPEFENWARENVVLLELDYPRRGMQSPEIKKQNEMLKQKYAISSYPTVLLIDPNGSQIGKMGYMKNPSEWISAADAQLYPVAGQ